MIWLILLQLVLIALNAVFACAEIAVLSMNETALERMAEGGNKKAKRLRKLTREPAKFLATIQVAITLSGFLGSAFAADNFAGPLVDWVLSLGVEMDRGVLNTVAVILITLILSYFTLVFGELVPKRLAMKKAERVAMGISGVVSGISVIFKPIVAFLSLSTNLVLRLCGIDPNAMENEVDEEEILMMVDAGSEQGAIESHERKIIQNIFEFDDTTASDIATRRNDVVFLDLEDDDAVWSQLINESRYTLLPIARGDVDNIEGVLFTHEYFRLADKSRENVMKNAVHAPYFVPGNITGDILLRNMKSTKNPMAVVIDEYGGMEGIITVSDLIDELLADTYYEDEDEDKPHLERLGDNTWNVIGNVALDDIEEQTGVKIENEDVGTLTGVVFDILGVIPDDGDVDICVDVGPLSIRVTKIESHCITGALITKNETAADTSEDE